MFDTDIRNFIMILWQYVQLIYIKTRRLIRFKDTMHLTELQRPANLTKASLDIHS